MHHHCLGGVHARTRRATDPPQPPPANQAFSSQHAAGERSAAPPSPPFCTSAPTAARQCPLGSVLAGEQPDSSRVKGNWVILCPRPAGRAPKAPHSPPDEALICTACSAQPVESRAGYTRVYEETRWWQPPHA